jgi:hypothetical protein
MTCSIGGAHDAYEQAVLLNIWTLGSFLLIGKKVEARLGRLQQQKLSGGSAFLHTAVCEMIAPFVFNLSML